MLRRIVIAALCGLMLGFLPGCYSHIQPPTDDERTQYDYWRTQISAKESQRIIDAADRRTDWSERRKVTWCAEQFYRVAQADMRRRRQAREAAATQATSRPAHYDRSATQPAP